MWKHGIKKATPIADIRELLAKEQTVQPPEWFQAVLTQINYPRQWPAANR